MSLFTAALNAFSSQSAAKAQKRAADAALGLQKQQYEQQRTDYAPYREAGSTALGQLSNLYGQNGQQAQTDAFAQFREDPGAAYARNQAINSVTASRAAQGGGYSGSTLKGISDRVQNLSDQNYGTYLSRLQGLMSGGLQAAGGTANAGQNYANQSSALYGERGQANAASALAPAIAYNKSVDNVYKLAGDYLGGSGGAFRG